MKLYDLLRTITHDNYTVYLQDINFFNEERILYNPLNNKKEILKNYLDYEDQKQKNNINNNRKK